MRVQVEYEQTTIAKDDREIDGLIVTCTRCGAEVEVYGTGPASIRKACVMLKEQCSERNFYTDEEDEAA